MIPAFHGAKIAILTGGCVVTILRDDRADIPWPGHWDLPGGGREGGETPLDCALRETREELGLLLEPGLVRWRRDYARGDGLGRDWFFALRDEGFDPAQVRFGDEGQGWRLMPVAEFRAHRLAVPHLAARLEDYLAEVERGVPAISESEQRC